MKRWSAFAVVVVAVVSVAFVAGASKPVEEKKPDAVKPAVAVGHKTAVFNMAAVMRDFHQAKYQVWQLNNKKNEMAKQLLAWRSEYNQIDI